jgi:hypothetical protein
MFSRAAENRFRGIVRQPVIVGKGSGQGATLQASVEVRL